MISPSPIYHLIGHSLSSPRSDDTNATTGDIPKADMEPTEVGTNDHEYTKWLVGVLNLGQKVAREAEGKRDLGRLVKVGLENVPNKSKTKSCQI
jgi:hypothetical protein